MGITMRPQVSCGWEPGEREGDILHKEMFGLRLVGGRGGANVVLPKGGSSTTFVLPLEILPH